MLKIIIFLSLLLNIYETNAMQSVRRDHWKMQRETELQDGSTVVSHLDILHQNNQPPQESAGVAYKPTSIANIIRRNFITSQTALQGATFLLMAFFAGIENTRKQPGSWVVLNETTVWQNNCDFKETQHLISIGTRCLTCAGISFCCRQCIKSGIECCEYCEDHQE